MSRLMGFFPLAFRFYDRFLGALQVAADRLNGAFALVYGCLVAVQDRLGRRLVQ